ncbi:MAG: prolyl 4-hydroxylase [Crocinitomicaceae bacterium]|jgi:prolyl 4-hydroxylase
MTQLWFPQRKTTDSLVASVKTLIYYVHHPISRSKIEDDIVSHKEFPALSFKAISQILDSWGMKNIVYKLPSFKLNDVPTPSLTLINEMYRGKMMGIPIVFFQIENNTVSYCHPRKGWMDESLNSFETKWCEAMISLTGIEGFGELDFEKKERLYNRKKLDHPNITLVKQCADLLTYNECNYIVSIAEERFKPSKLGAESILGDGRTSYSAFLDIKNDFNLEMIRKKISKFLNIDSKRFEHFQCVSYAEGQEYQAHYDIFDANTIEGQAEIALNGQRHFTLLIYLNDDFEGGQTYFPHLDLLFTPKKGAGLFFNNTDGNGSLIESSFHAGLPVSFGRKLALNLWIREM